MNGMLPTKAGIDLESLGPFWGLLTFRKDPLAS